VRGRTSVVTAPQKLSKYRQLDPIRSNRDRLRPVIQIKVVLPHEDMLGVVRSPDVYNHLLRQRPSTSRDKVELPDVRRAYIDPEEHGVLLVNNQGITKPPGCGDPSGCLFQSIGPSLSRYRIRPVGVIA